MLTKLDKVEEGVIHFFEPAAERLLASAQPVRVLAAALAAMSGFQTVPNPRSLLTGEEGVVTFKLLGKPGRVDGFRNCAVELQKVIDEGGGGSCGWGGGGGEEIGFCSRQYTPGRCGLCKVARAVPNPRSLLTGEEGVVTFKLLGKPGRVDGFRNCAVELQRVRAKGGGVMWWWEGSEDWGGEESGGCSRQCIAPMNCICVIIPTVQCIQVKTLIF